ncbi:MAG: VWA domain-containing protein [Candidatus Aenigmarchaeota archaeon]|nr:VWA domain-containing protein [Candidatus Aenigmarchaeota archaeon]
MAVTFDNIVFAWLGVVVVALVIAIYFIGARFTRKRALLFGNFESLEKAVGKQLLARNFQMLAIRVMIIISLSFSLAGVALVYEHQQPAVDMVLAIDTSLTMSATDYAPDRLAVAKRGAAFLVDNMPSSSRIGIVSFADKADGVSAITDRHREIKRKIEGLQIAPRAGTAIGNALLASSDALYEKGGVIVLVTDGNNNVGISVDEGLQAVLARNVTVYTVGIGSTAGEDAERVDTAALQKIANLTRGLYFFALNESAVGDIYESLADKLWLRKSDTVALSSYLLLAAFLLIVVEWLLINTRYRTIP